MGSLLLVLPVPFREHGGQLWLESQACNGLQRWAENFGRVVVACPLEPADRHVPSQESYSPVSEIPAAERIQFIPLPWAYGMRHFLKTYRPTRQLIAEQIRSCDYSSFSIGGLVGDWASIACLESIRQRRPFSVWTDRVEHRVVTKDYRDQVGIRRLKRWFLNRFFVAPLMYALHRHVIGRAALGLFHGRDCYEAYSPYCRQSYVVHDIHLKAADRIPLEQLQRKKQRNGPLQIIYAGRAIEMKGPMDWIESLKILNQNGVDFRASWLGDGPQLEAMKAEVQRLSLQTKIEFVGHVADRGVLIQRLREADVFMFCHLTPESPRCLIEALMSGCVLVGYDSPYVRELVEHRADQLLVPLRNTHLLANRLEHLHQDRAELEKLIDSCAVFGQQYSDEAVFRHRSELVKQFVVPRGQKEGMLNLPVGS